MAHAPITAIPSFTRPAGLPTQTFFYLAGDTPRFAVAVVPGGNDQTFVTPKVVAVEATTEKLPATRIFKVPIVSGGGTPQTIPVAGLISEQAFGAVSIHSVIAVPITGLASEQAFGTATALPGGVVITVPGLASEQAFGAVTANPGVVIVPVSGLDSEQAFGGVTPLEHTTVAVPGLASAQAFGTITPIVGPAIVLVPGLGSEQAFGTPTIQGGIGPSFTPAQMGKHFHR